MRADGASQIADLSHFGVRARRICTGSNAKPLSGERANLRTSAPR
jgi:hypothetical protein